MHRVLVRPGTDRLLARLSGPQGSELIRRFVIANGHCTRFPPGELPADDFTPLTRRPIHCFDEDDFPGHGDVSPSAQEDLSQIFSSLDTQVNTIGPSSEDVTLHETDQHGISYDYSASWVDGCVATVAEQNFGFRLPRPV